MHFTRLYKFEHEVIRLHGKRLTENVNQKRGISNKTFAII